MTAVAPPLNFQSTARSGWNSSSAAQNGISPAADDVSRMFMPSRKSVQRSNSSSSIASTASSSSSSSTISSSSVQTNGAPASAPPDASWGSRKKPARGLWPALKAEPIAGLSTARPQSMASSSSTASSAASTTSALHTPPSMLPSQHGASSQAQSNGTPRQQNDPPAILHLVPLNGTFERKTITVPYFPEVLRIGRQTNNKTIPTPLNGYFDSKVLSRQHAEVWADRSGKIWIRDVKSSNGTFVNGTRLSPENRDSEAHELREQDMLELGIDIISEDQKTIVHHKVAAKVEHAGIYPNANNMLDLNFGDLDPAGNGNLMPSLGPGQMRGRNGSTGSMMSNGRLGPSAQNMAGNNISMTQQRHSSFWLQPVTMEQIVKKLNSEMKQARQQTQELHRTGQYIESILANDHKKEASKTSSLAVKSPLKSDIKARFSDPPAPPPSQPLPEKPDAAQPSLRRIETEKPKLPNAKGEQSSQISSLVEALTSAKKELDVQSIRLKELEDMLARERQLRESAEEHVQRLEMGRANDSATTIITTQSNGAQDIEHDENAASKAPSEDAIVAEPAPAPDAGAHTTQLQQRLESMVAEMERMKQEMGSYKLRAERAEADSARDRQTLAEMIESIRKDESKRISKSSRAHEDQNTASINTAGGVDGTIDPTIADRAEKADLGDKVAEHGAAARQSILSNGRPVSDTNGHAKDTGSQVLATKSQGGEQLAHVGPYASMVGVVVLGLSIMAYINGWQKPLER
ncbi:cytoplasm to vacuole targeting Vps64 [Phyllosticta citricarpa]|uniref:Cytoplasm to vacuole targeting Vps64 n=1 Tax=Phyllosticta citricarpa TaxID=55181 RepID=A0ABR1MP87_9PEZI